MTVLTFDEAIAEAQERTGKRHILLGNGFSIACRPDLFAYGRLFDEADFDALSIGRRGLVCDLRDERLRTRDRSAAAVSAGTGALPGR